MNGFSWSRVLAILVKEFTQLRRERGTYIVIIAMPIVQLLLYGYAINGDPHHVRTAVLIQDDGPFARSILGQLPRHGEVCRCRSSGRAFCVSYCVNHSVSRWESGARLRYSYLAVRGGRSASQARGRV